MDNTTMADPIKSIPSSQGIAHGYEEDARDCAQDLA
jgi:hypothetical protein